MIAQKNVDYAVEVNDLMDVLVVLVEGVKAKKSPAEVMAKVFPEIMQAISGLAQLGTEVQMNPKVVAETVGFRLGEIAALMVP